MEVELEEHDGEKGQAAQDGPEIGLHGAAGFTRDLWDGRVHVATCDISDCFHRFRIWDEFAEYFGLPGVPAGLVNKKEINGVPVLPDQLVTPCWSSLPMGFSHSLALVQQGGSFLLEEAGACFRSPLLDSGPSAVLQAGGPRERRSRHYLYVGNLGL